MLQMIFGRRIPAHKSGEPRFPSFRTAIITGAIYLIIPAIFAITTSRLTHAKGPHWLAPDFEGPYAYLFNSLLLLNGDSPEHIDHPGTTAQIFGAVVLRVSSIKSSEKLIRSIIKNPELYIRRIQSALSILTVLTLWLAPWITALILRNHLIGLLIQAPFLFYQSVLSYALFFGPDFMMMPFTIIVVCLCTMMIAPSLGSKQLDVLIGAAFGSGDQIRIRRLQAPLLPLLSGIVCALGIATKLTFFPLILLSLLCCRSLRKLTTFVAAFIVSLAIVLMPIYSKLDRLGAWVFSLGVHSGIYGQGAVGLPGAGEYLDSMKSLFQAEPLVIIIPLVAAIGVLLLAKTSSKIDIPRISWRTAVPLLALQMICFVAIAKHPGPQYLIPLCLSTGFSLVLLFSVLQSTIGTIRKFIGWILLIGLLFLGFKSFVELTPDNYKTLQKAKINLVRLYKHAQQIGQTHPVAYYYSSDSPEFALSFGDSASGGVFGPILAEFHPKALFLDVFTNQFETFNEVLDPETVLRQHDILYFLGDPANLHRIDGLDPKTFETVDQAEGFYLQKWTRQ